MLYPLLLHFVFGLLIGSFLNVLILRHHTGRSANGRSGCLHCEKPLTWTELIPVVSWFLQSGRCRSCGTRISLQYPLVEIGTAFLFAAVYLFGFPPVQHVLSLGIVSTLVFIFTYDLKHTIIPDRWVYLFSLLALMYSGYTVLPYATLADVLMLVAAGPLVALPLALMWALSSGRWMGLGDAKLALGMGWLLGPWFGFIAVLDAFIIGAVVSVLALLAVPRVAQFIREISHARSLRRSGKEFTMKREVPFGPFLIASCLLQWFLIELHLTDVLPGVIGVLL
jgi:prepilin signal peptidase PulO-like enzyme (type II secretory pathway)